eukprot:3826590-Rhodomonas_salina.1
MRGASFLSSPAHLTSGQCLDSTQRGQGGVCRYDCWASGTAAWMERAAPRCRASLHSVLKLVQWVASAIRSLAHCAGSTRAPRSRSLPAPSPRLGPLG